MSDQSEREVLAEFEQRIRLVRRTGADGEMRFEIEEDDLDTKSSVVRAHFAHADFPRAAIDYGWKLSESLGGANGEMFSVLMRTLEGFAYGDVDSLTDLLHADYAHYDHRLLGYPDFDKAGMLEQVRVQPTQSAVWLNQHHHVFNEFGGVFTGAYWMCNFGEWTPYEFGVHLGVIRDGQLLQAEVFPEDQIAEAIARFDQLAEQFRR